MYPVRQWREAETENACDLQRQWEAGIIFLEQETLAGPPIPFFTHLKISKVSKQNKFRK